jgi:hypothetical protein
MLKRGWFGFDDPDMVFEGSYDPAQSWNGWLIPRFDDDEIEVVIDAVRHGLIWGVHMWWFEDTLVFAQTDGEEWDKPQVIRKDSDGLWRFPDGFTWRLFEPEFDPDTLRYVIGDKVLSHEEVLRFALNVTSV